MCKSNTEHYCESFAPILSEHPRVLILGTMPSVKSLEDAFYYAHPQNQFWPIMHSITGADISSITAKTALIKNNALALWDVLQACERKGSLDSAIQNPVANDFASLLDQYKSIKTIVFNGKKAEQLFKQHVIKKQTLPSYLDYVVMPSTSPANAALKKADKQLFWQENISHLL
jgi:TDG/mug DNA glycosylase family protein